MVKFFSLAFTSVLISPFNRETTKTRQENKNWLRQVSWFASYWLVYGTAYIALSFNKRFPDRG